MQHNTSSSSRHATTSTNPQPPTTMAPRQSSITFGPGGVPAPALPPATKLIGTSTTITLGGNKLSLPKQETQAIKALDSMLDAKRNVTMNLSDASHNTTALGGVNAIHVTADMDLTAKVQVEGADELIETAKSAAFLFDQMAVQLGQIRPALNPKEAKEQRSKQRAVSTANDLMDSLASRNLRTPLARQMSLEFTSSIGTIDKDDMGADAYIAAMRKLLPKDPRTSVTVTFSDLSFQVPGEIPSDKNKSTRATVGSVLCDVTVGPIKWLVGKFHQLTSGGPPPIPDMDVLHDLTGLIRPGSLTLVLGPPGSGKSSFLKAMAGRLYDVPVGKVKGEVRYAGKNIATLPDRSHWVSYVGQTDEHQPMLTTRETLAFAWRCCREPELRDKASLATLKSRLGDEAVKMLEDFRDIEVDFVLAVLGLKGCANTIIGDATHKGVSGGEKRRVTLGEMLVTGTNIVCCDEISTGLDAAATYDICEFLAHSCHVLNRTIVCALLQPPPNVIDLFDDIVVLAEGRIIYHGPRDTVQAYFEGLGYKCPDNKELGDFLQEIPTKNGAAMLSGGNGGTTTPPPRTPADFEMAWKSTETFKKMQREIRLNQQQMASSIDELPPITNISFTRSLLLCLHLVMVLRLREVAQLGSKVATNIIMGLFFGSLFYQLKFDEWYLKSMLIFQVPSFILSSAFPQVQIIASQKAIFLKHVEARFFTPLVFTLAQTIVGVPFIVFDLLVFGNIVYWLVGLSANTEVFLWFLLISVSYGLTMSAAMMLYPFISPNEDSAIMKAVLMLVTMMIMSGLLATENQIPSYLIWMYYANPMAWVYRALAINEYHSGGDYDQRPCEFEIQGHKLKVDEKCGDYFLEARQTGTDDAMIWQCVVVCWGIFAALFAYTIYAVAYVRYDPERAKRVNKQDDTNEKYLALVRENDLEAHGGNGGASATATLRAPLLRQDSVVIPRKVVVVRNLFYTIDLPDGKVDLLNNVSFWAEPGRMTALMGSSGAGKTTLMDVIAGRKTVGVARGDILVDGIPKVQSEFVKYSGYVEQFGVHSPASTVIESLRFSADLRLPSSISEHRKANYVKECLDLLELDELADQCTAGLSMEQNKRLTLGVELVSGPSILFADEPTSGLDARAAAIVMKVLKKIAQSGRTVICTIHQPSNVIFSFFDDLLLLKKGGHIVFFGPLGTNSSNLIQYLESIPGTTKFPQGQGANPASWMLEAIGAGTTGDGAGRNEETGEKIDYGHCYTMSALKRSNDAKLENEMLGFHSATASSSMRMGAGTSSPERRRASVFEKFVKSPYARGYVYQTRMLLNRLFQNYWRTPDFTLARFFVVMLFTFMFSAIFANSELHVVVDVQSRIILMYFFNNLLGMYNLYCIVPFVMQRRALFYRERATGMFSLTAYVTADTLVEIPYVFAEVMMGACVLYAIVGLNSNTGVFIYFLADSYLLCLLHTYLGILFAWLMPDTLSAQLSAISFLQIFQIFSGIMIPAANLAAPYKPLYYSSMYRWSQEGIITTQFHGNKDEICVPYGNIPPSGSIAARLNLCTSDGSADLGKIVGLISTVEDFALNQFLPDFHYDRRWDDLIFLASWIVGVRVLLLMAIHFINYNKR